MTSTALARVADEPRALTTPAPRAGLLRPIAAPTEVLEAQNDTRALIREALVDGRDYGVIPGTERKDKAGRDISKKVLLKAGAERLCAAFGLVPTFEVLEKEVDHEREVKWVKRSKVWRNQFRGDKEYTWKEESGTALGLYRYVIGCTLTLRETGAVVAQGIGSCSTLESKYQDRPRECENTVVKMGSKRALVAATLLALGLSDEFTQDIEEQGGADVTEKWDRPAQPAAPEPEPEPEPPLTLALALAMPLPGEPGNPKVFGGKGGQPLSAASPSLLKGLAKWIDGSDELKAKYERLRGAIHLVYEHRIAEAKAAEEAEQTKAPAAVTAPVQDGAPAVGAADDDDLPFSAGE